MLSKLAEIRKALVAGIGVTLTALTFAHTWTFLPTAWTVAVGTVIAILTPILTWLAPNKQA